MRVEETAEPFPTRDDLVRLLPGYHLLRELSRTNMSSVYLAEETALGRRVALKILSRDLAGQPEFRKRFQREVGLAARLEHPNIIPVYTAGESGDVCYLTMRYVDGADLRTILRDESPLPLDRIVRLMGQVAAALDAAHETGLIHRDVKPGNVLVDRRSGHAYLCDFGIAKNLSAETLTTDDRVAGTPDYMAPEQIQGHPVDHRADIYSLGCMIFHCLTGAKPYARTGTPAAMWAHVHDPIPLAGVARPELSAAVDTVMTKAMAKLPQDRYDSCGDLVEDLARAVRGGDDTVPLMPVWAPRPDAPTLPPLGTPTGGTPLPVVAPGNPRRRKRIVIALTAVVVLAAGAVVAITHPWTGGSGATAVNADLLARVPEPLRAGCSPGAQANTLTCKDSAGHDAAFTLYADQSTMDSAYQQAVQESGVAKATGDCSAAMGAEHRYPYAGAPAGRVLCFTRDGGATVVWTDTRAKVVGRAGVAADQEGALIGWWTGWVGVPAFPTKDEQTLVNLVEERDCHRAAAGSLEGFRPVVAAVDCTPASSGARTLSYYQFASLGDLQATYDAHATDAHAPTGVYCGDGKATGFLGNRRYDLRSVELGGLLCRPGPQSTLVMEWSVESMNLLGRVVGTDPKDLSSWWDGNYGPPTPKIVTALNAQAHPSFPDEKEKALLQHIPEPSRKNCLRPPREQVLLNVPKEPVVGVVCGPNSGVRIVFYYQFADQAAMARNYGGGGGASGPDCTTLPQNFSGESAYPGGRLLCATNDSGSRYLVWTNDKLAIETFGFQGYEPGAMIDWWRHDAGPV